MLHINSKSRHKTPHVSPNQHPSACCLKIWNPIPSNGTVYHASQIFLMAMLYSIEGPKFLYPKHPKAMSAMDSACCRKLIMSWLGKCGGTIAPPKPDWSAHGGDDKVIKKFHNPQILESDEKIDRKPLKQRFPEKWPLNQNNWPNSWTELESYTTSTGLATWILPLHVLLK